MHLKDYGKAILCFIIALTKAKRSRLFAENKLEYFVKTMTTK